MNNLKISYLITCHDETDIFNELLTKISCAINNSQICVESRDEIIILEDNKKPSLTFDTPTQKIIEKHMDNAGKDREWFVHHQRHSLDNNYGEHKNFGNSLCVGDYIFQIDGDEIPSEYIIGENLHTILESNVGTELIFVPRMNDFIGVTPQHAMQWGWKLSESPSLKHPLINFPDFQGRIYRRVPERIKWDRRLHEKIVGHDTFVLLPPDEDFALHHRKTIDKQIQTNLSYNKRFTLDENKGHKVV